MKDTKYYMQVVIVKEFFVEATDELQAEKAAFAEAGADAHNIVGIKCYGPADEYIGEGALSENMIYNMEEVRTFEALNVEWCESE